MDMLAHADFAYSRAYWRAILDDPFADFDIARRDLMPKFEGGFIDDRALANPQAVSLFQRTNQRVYVVLRRAGEEAYTSVSSVRQPEKKVVAQTFAASISNCNLARPSAESEFLCQLLRKVNPWCGALSP